MNRWIVPLALLVLGSGASSSAGAKTAPSTAPATLPAQVRGPQEVFVDIQREGQALRDVLTSPEVLTDAKQRAAAAQKAVPALQTDAGAWRRDESHG